MKMNSLSEEGLSSERACKTLKHISGSYFVFVKAMGSLCRFLRLGWHEKSMFEKKREPHNFRGLALGIKWNQMWINWSLEEMLFYLLSGPSGINDVFSAKKHMGDLLY